MKNHDNPSKACQSLGSLPGLKENLTPNQLDSGSNIINDLPFSEQYGGLLIGSTMAEEMDHPGCKDAKTDVLCLKIRGELASINAHLCQLSLQRRQALNDYLDLKGNIRVFCRVRSLLQEESNRLRPIITTDSSSVFLKITGKRSNQYSFDKVFHPECTQEEVFSEIEPVIKSALDGYNVCIFAYGQTGTGKTYTMEGMPESPGMVPRTIEVLFKQALESNCKYIFTFSMLEIYMGSLRDLLVPQKTKLRIPKVPCLSIQTDSNGGIQIENLVAIEVSDSKEVKRLYKLGSRLRSTASTMSNSTSSRSHCLIRILLTCPSAPGRRRKTNKIWMVDLGGSERLLKTKASGRRMEEGKAINLSLSALGDVISALQHKKHHVPYRNSKLTQVLKDSLGSDSKTLMLAHVSPKEEDICETVCSLGFATRMRSIHLGSEESTEERAKKEVDIAEVLQKVMHFESEHQATKRNIDRLHERLKQLERPETSTEGKSKLSIIPTDVMQPSVTQKINKGASSRLPRFMRPTLSSQRKTSLEHHTLESTRRKLPVPLKKSSSVYDESVTSPAKCAIWPSDCSSDRSVSTVNYLNWTDNADDGTGCSQTASEYEVKKVIFPEEEKSPGSLTAHSSVSIDEMENGLLDITDQDRQLIIDDWHHFQLTEQASTYTHPRTKRVISISMDETSSKCSEQNCVHINYKEERQYFVGNGNQVTFSKEHMDDFIKEDVNMYGTTTLYIEKSHKNKTMDQSHSFIVGASSCSTDCECHQNKDLEMPCREIELLPEHQHQKFIEIFKEIEVESDLSTMQGKLQSSHDNVISVDSYSKDVCESQQNEEKPKQYLLSTVRSRISLCMEKDLPTLDEKREATEDKLVPANKFQDENCNLGAFQQLHQTVQILWASALLGLGIQSLGFGDDFFHGLML